MLWKRPRVVYIDTRWLFLKIAAAILLTTVSLTYWNWTQVTLIQFESPELAASWQVSNKKLISQVLQGLKEAETVNGNELGARSVIMRLVSRRETRTYLIPETGRTYDCKNKKTLRNPKALNALLERAINELRTRSPFGEMLAWESVKEILPLGNEAVVRDLDSGKRFSIRRSGGHSHAMVEPLTGKDSAVVKELYSGRWSWKRRAVVVETGGKKIAASLSGMPTGSGEIRDNDCYGSVSLFFAGPATENSINLAHLVMIWKAAGKTSEKLGSLTPEEVILVLFTAIDQRDLKTAEQILPDVNEADRKALRDVIGVTVVSIRKNTDLTYRLKVRVSMQKGPYNYPRGVNIKLVKDRKLKIYKVEKDFLAILLRQTN